MNLELENREHAPRMEDAWLEALSESVLKALELEGIELSLICTGDEETRALNKEWRNKDQTTDVLSFPQFDAESLKHWINFPSAILGDVVINYDAAKRQAEEGNWSLGYEVARLFVHGVLHLTGHDHVASREQEAQMQAEEKRIMTLLHKQALIDEPYFK